MACIMLLSTKDTSPCTLCRAMCCSPCRTTGAHRYASIDCCNYNYPPLCLWFPHETRPRVSHPYPSPPPFYHNYTLLLLGTHSFSDTSQDNFGQGRSFQGARLVALCTRVARNSLY